MNGSIEFFRSLKNGDKINIDAGILSVINDMVNAMDYRIPVSVTEYISYPQNINGFAAIFEICPKCGLPITRTYQEYCSDCGQHLKWDNRGKMRRLYNN